MKSALVLLALLISTGCANSPLAPSSTLPTVAPTAVNAVPVTHSASLLPPMVDPDATQPPAPPMPTDGPASPMPSTPPPVSTTPVDPSAPPIGPVPLPPVIVAPMPPPVQPCVQNAEPFARFQGWLDMGQLSAPVSLWGVGQWELRIVADGSIVVATRTVSVDCGPIQQIYSVTTDWRTQPYTRYAIEAYLDGVRQPMTAPVMVKPAS